MSKVGGYFKIVEILNNDKSELSVVPNGWEKKGILFWPTKAAGLDAMNSIKDPNSLPDEKNWSKYRCKVKRLNVQWDFEAAEKEMNKMLERINTSAISESKSKMSVKCRFADCQQNIFNYVASSVTNQAQPTKDPEICEAENLLTSQKPQSHQKNVHNFNSNATTSRTINTPSPALNPTDGGYNINANVTMSSTIKTRSQAINPADGVDLCSLMTVLKTVSENVLSLNTKFDQMNKKVDRLMEIADNQPSKSHLPPSLISLKTIMDPIKTIDDLYEFEEKLKTKKEFSCNLIENLKHVCGENSMKGENAAYTLVDVIFSRKLMTELSWCGGSKKGGAPKTPFRQFEHVLKLFYTLVKKSDPRYTESDAKDFFKKKVLPNSLRRSMGPMIRASQPKTRLKRGRKPKTIDNTKQQELSESVKEEVEDGSESEEEEYDDVIGEFFEDFVKEESVEEESTKEDEDVPASPPLKRTRRSMKTSD